MAVDIAAGLDGVKRELSPPPAVEGDPYAADLALLPTSFEAGIDALAADPLCRQQFDGTLLDYFLMMKRAESARYTAAVRDDPPTEEQPVTPWEMREYFETY